MDDELDSLNRAETPLNATDDLATSATNSVSTDSLGTDYSVFEDRSIVVEDSLVRAIDEDPYDTISVNFQTEDTLNFVMGGGSSSGTEIDPIFTASAASSIQTSDISRWNGYGTYTNLSGKPKINSTELTGDKTSSELGLQAELVSGTNIKTVNNESILGSGNISVSGVTDYDNLTSRPQINSITLSGNKSLTDLGIINFSGDYDDLTNKPTIPTQTSQLTNNSGFITSTYHDDTKVDKETGKTLTSNDYTTAEKDKLAGLSNYDDTAVKTLISQKVDKENGKSLIETTKITKLDGIEAEANKTIINNTVTSTSTTEALSANMGKTLQEEIDNLKARGRFLALWDAATGLALSDPSVSPYTYKTGDYYIIGQIGTTRNYKPTGSTYTIGVASTVIESNTIAVDDVYYYDGANWRLQANTQKSLSFANISGQPTDNANLATALNAKQDTVSDLSTIRSGAAAGATALQSGDNVSELLNDAGYLIAHQDISGKENTSNKSSSYTVSSTTTYPNTKALVDGLATKENSSNKSSSYTTSSTTTYPNTKALVDGLATKQATLATQTAYSSKGSATKVPQITTNTLGQVTGITEVTITQPTVNDATLTIQKNGTNVATFSSNSGTNTTANIVVPGIQDNLTSTSTTDGLSANQGKVLNNGKMGAVSANGYYGMARPDGNTSDWIRTTSQGIIPYQSGTIGSGHGGLGTASWYFSTAYIDNVHSNKTYITENSYMQYNSTDKCIEFIVN